jgi:predicted transport protein
VSRFVDSIEELETQNDIRDVLDREVNEDKVLKALIEKKTGQDSFRFLTELVSKPPKIALIVDKITPEVEKASKSLKKLADTKIIEFQTFVREDAPNVHAHLFEPLYGVERVEVKEKEERERKIPEHYKDWQSLFNWVEDSVKDVTKALESNIISINPSEVTKAVHGRYLCFYRGKPSTKSIFAAFLLTKKALKVRIRTDPSTFKDPQKLTGDKVYKGWFFKQGQEREFKITSKEQIPYAMELIKQSYGISGKV